MRNGRPRVSLGGSPYDTAQAIETLSRLRQGSPSTPGDHRVDHGHSGFFDRLVADYFTHGSIPVRLKDVGKAMFGTATEERTTTWGDTTDLLSFTASTAEAGGQTTNLALHVNRQRPTSFTLLTTVNLYGQGWTAEGVLTMQVLYTVGIGLVQTTVQKNFTINAPAPNTQPVLDVTTLPLQSLVGAVSFIATNNNVNQLHGIHVTMLAAPVVQ